MEIRFPWADHPLLKQTAYAWRFRHMLCLDDWPLLFWAVLQTVLHALLADGLLRLCCIRVGAVNRYLGVLARAAGGDYAP